MSEQPIDTTPQEPTDAAPDQAEVTQSEAPAESQGGAGVGGINPAWSPLLEALPESLHHLVQPHLQQWDKGVQDRFAEINAKYDPWKEFMDSGTDPETAAQALSILQQINEDPQAIYNSLGEYFGYGTAQAATPGANQELDGESDTGDYVDPKMAELEQGFQALANIILEQQQTTQAAQEDQALEQELSSMHAKHGDFDETFVLTQMLNGASADEAISAWEGVVNKIQSGSVKPPAPVVMGNGGGVPVSQKDVTGMSGQQTRGMVAEILRQASST